MTLIETQNLSAGYGGKPLFSGLDLSLGRGETLCLLGPNGVGKTTLFRTLLGLLPALGGELWLGDEDIGRLSRREIASRIAYVPQAQRLPFSFTVRDIVLMGRSASLGAFALPGPRDHDLTDEALKRLGIVDLADRDMSRLSGGQQQMVLIARALAQGAPSMVMDEPTASLDLANRGRIGNLVKALAADGIGIVFSTHDPDQAADISDRVILLGPGGVLAAGRTEEVMNGETLDRLYGVKIRRETLSDGSLHFRAR